MAGYGTGNPQWFACPVERRERNDARWLRGSSYAFTEIRRRHTVTLTGRTKPRPNDGNLGLRTSTTSREYKCSCGHVGWSTHVDLERM